MKQNIRRIAITKDASRLIWSMRLARAMYTTNIKTENEQLKICWFPIFFLLLSILFFWKCKLRLLLDTRFVRDLWIRLNKVKHDMKNIIIYIDNMKYWNMIIHIMFVIIIINHHDVNKKDPGTEYGRCHELILIYFDLILFASYNIYDISWLDTILIYGSSQGDLI